MATSVLVLGGSGFAGRAVVCEAIDRGWEVTTFNRGRGWSHPAARRLLGDREHAASLAALSERDWDIVLDTWSGAPRAVRDSAEILSTRAGRYVYVSSESVYAPPPRPGADETAPTAEAAPDADDGSYPELKRGAEIAVEQAFGERALLLRPGLILGPHEDVGRLPWWLSRMARGGEVLCPGPADLPLQFIDARDLARFALDAASAGQHGAFNVVSRRGHATMGSLLAACRAVAGAPGTELRWLPPDVVTGAGIEPWTELPVWIPPDHEYAAMHDASVERAHGAGLRCRPVEDTVSDTWRWMQTLEGPAPLRDGLEPPGLDPARERAVLAP